MSNLNEKDITNEHVKEDEDQYEEDNDGLKKHYDIIILGTGLVESIIACAASKSGKSVLHLEKNDYYGNNI
jgi:RAB protein geranylgeranyltransferase component A